MKRKERKAAFATWNSCAGVSERFLFFHPFSHSFSSTDADVLHVLRACLSLLVSWVAIVERGGGGGNPDGRIVMLPCWLLTLSAL